MPGPENNENFVPEAESGTFCLDLDNSQIDAKSELKSSDYSLLGSADDGAAHISLHVQITKQVSEEGAAGTLVKSFSESNLLGYSVHGSTGVDSLNNDVVKTIDSTVIHEDISANGLEIDVNSQLLLKSEADSVEFNKNHISFTEEVFLKDRSSPKIQNQVDHALSTDQSETGSEDTQEKIVSPKTIYYQKMESTQGLKESVSNSRSENILHENECKLLESSELSPDVTVDMEQVQGAEKSLDLEDGEVSCDDGDDPLKAATREIPVCRFFNRNGCSWGPHCRFRHPGSNKGNYVMFENKVLPVVSRIFPPVWPPYLSPAFPINNMDTEPYYSPDQMEVVKRGPLLPTPSPGDILMTPMNYPKSVELDRFITNPDKPLISKPIVWQSRRYSGSPSSTTLQKSPSRTRSPSVSPPRYDKHVRLEIGPTDTSSVTCKPSLKRYRLPSPPKSVIPRIRGPRTPSCSPPKRPKVKLRAKPKRQRLNRYLSSSTDSSSSYQSTTESSEESSSSSESDRVQRSRSNRRSVKSLFKKQSSRISSKSTSRSSTKSKATDIEWSSALIRTSRHSTKSKTRKHSPRSPNKLLTRTPDRASPRVTTKARFREDGFHPNRREYLLKKLMEVEEKIAKKKKKMNLK